MSANIPLAPAEIHLWLASYDQINDERLHAAYRSLLTAAERVQEGRFYFAKDRRRYLVTRALLRTVLSRYLPVRPQDWSFSTNAYGRPEAANPEARQAGLTFNLSHTDSLIVLGVTRERAIGVDVENVVARHAAIDVADHFFAPPEVAELHKAAPELQHYRFFEYWTFKESYIKARGMGLSLPLDKFSFHYSDETAVEIAIDPELSDHAGRWQFWQLQPAPEYLVAVCAERAAAASPRLTVRRAVPMLGEYDCTPRYLRVSQHSQCHNNPEEGRSR